LRIARTARLAWLGLLAWLAVRFAMLLAEVLWQPLYPWDAWIQWADEAARLRLTPHPSARGLRLR